MENRNREVMAERIKKMKATHDMKKLKNPASEKMKGEPYHVSSETKQKQILKETLRQNS